MEELKVNLWDWVVLKDGTVLQITDDDMPNVPHEIIDRLATNPEIVKAGGIPTKMDKRIYIFVPYNISDKQKGIQALHAAQKYDRKYEGSSILHDFIDNHMTCIMLDGGTTNNHPDRLGTLNKIYLEILNFSAMQKNPMIMFSIFYEPDLNDALTSVAFIADERVFDFETYPEFYNWLTEIKMYTDASKEFQRHPEYRRLKPEQFQTLFPEYYDQWVQEVLGGYDIELLRNLTRGKKLA
jgi:hypothetical protein